MKFTVRQLESMGAKRKGAPAALPKPRRASAAKVAGIVPTPTRVGWEMLAFEVRIHGIRLISELNRREHHMVTYRRKCVQQDIVEAAFICTRPRAHGFNPPIRVTMTRIAPRNIEDGDNLISSAKHVRDQIARVLGVNDGDARNEWVVEQRRDGRGLYGIEIRIERRTGC